jgi:cyclophilin family peptidyl-prolyl cis-trans isomerase
MALKRAIFATVLLSLLSTLSGCGDMGEPDTSKDNNVLVIIDTSMGKIKCELFAQKAPITVANFLKYVDERFYDGTIFHRVIAGFMIQGGGMELFEEKPAEDSKAKEKPVEEPKEKEVRKRINEKTTYKAISNEAGNRLKNRRGTLAMARTNDPNSATSQFFINVKYNDSLDRARDPKGIGYAVFGRVLEGMEVVDAISNVSTDGPPNDRPLKDVIIKSIRRAE